MNLLFPALFKEYRVKGVTIPNRFMRSATAENMVEGEDGVADDRYAQVLARLAAGGAGLIVSGVCYVAKIGRMTRRQVGIHHDDTIPALARAVNAARAAGDAVLICQIGHTGRQTVPDVIDADAPLAPSAVLEKSAGVVPREMTAVEIEEVIEQFADAARRAELAGFDGIQLHGAHGYLINQFLSPYTNRRTDEWGGDTPEERMRFLEETYEACRAEAGDDFLIMIKMNGDDGVPGGVDLEQNMVYVRRLAELGIDGIEISGGIYEAPWSTIRGGIPFDMYTPDVGQQVAMKADQHALQLTRACTEGYHLDWAEALKPLAPGVPMACVGGWKTPLRMDQAIVEGKVDFVSMSRPLIRNPEFPNQVRAGAVVPSDCASCNRCLMHETWGDPLRCYYREGLRKDPEVNVSQPPDAPARKR